MELFSIIITASSVMFVLSEGDEMSIYSYVLIGLLLLSVLLQWLFEKKGRKVTWGIKIIFLLLMLAVIIDKDFF